ncbi:MAG: hypothetical protein IKL80_00890, partial [Clostridia bacterium]|nr:hypothetical protein [Clostridia bacterium]
MDYIKVTFNEMPRVLFSHKHEAAAFTFHFSKSDVFLEICYVDVGDLFAECDNGDMVHTKAGTLSVSWNKPKTSSSHGEFHRHFTAAIGGQCRTELLSQKEATETLKKNAVEDENSYTVLLPKKIEDAKYAKQGASIIKSIIYERNLPKVNLLKVNTLVFNL